MRAKETHARRAIQKFLPAVQGRIVVVGAPIGMTWAWVSHAQPRQSLKIDAKYVEVCYPFSRIQDRDDRFHDVRFLVYRPSLCPFDFERQCPVGEAEM